MVLACVLTCVLKAASIPSYPVAAFASNFFARCVSAGIPAITANLKNGGARENAAAMANHTSTRTNQLYDRRCDDIQVDEIGRVSV